jgi:hypothetical protein
VCEDCGEKDLFIAKAHLITADNIQSLVVEWENSE